MAASPSPTELAVRGWVERFVMGLGMCPFARPAQAGIRYVEVPGTELKDILQVVLDEAVALDAVPADQPGTTLVIVPQGLEDFDDFLIALDTVQQMLADAGYEGVQQVASFHPDYLFNDEPEDDPSNWTNRAPVPIFHLLREADVTQATTDHPDAAGIPARNQALLRKLGLARVRQVAWGDAAG